MDRETIAKRLESLKKLVDEVTFEFSNKENSEEFKDELTLASIAFDDALDIVDRDIAYDTFRSQMRGFCNYDL